MFGYRVGMRRVGVVIGRDAAVVGGAVVRREWCFDCERGSKRQKNSAHVPGKKRVVEVQVVEFSERYHGGTLSAFGMAKDTCGRLVSGRFKPWKCPATYVQPTPKQQSRRRSQARAALPPAVTGCILMVTCPLLAPESSVVSGRRPPLAISAFSLRYLRRCAGFWKTVPLCHESCLSGVGEDRRMTRRRKPKCLQQFYST